MWRGVFGSTDRGARARAHAAPPWQELIYQRGEKVAVELGGKEAALRRAGSDSGGGTRAVPAHWHRADEVSII